MGEEIQSEHGILGIVRVDQAHGAMAAGEGEVGAVADHLHLLAQVPRHPVHPYGHFEEVGLAKEAEDSFLFLSSYVYSTYRGIYALSSIVFLFLQRGREGFCMNSTICSYEYKARPHTPDHVWFVLFLTLRVFYE